MKILSTVFSCSYDQKLVVALLFWTTMYKCKLTIFGQRLPEISSMEVHGAFSVHPVCIYGINLLF